MRCRRLRAVFFDVGGTLIQPWPSVGAVYAAVAARHGWVVDMAAIQNAFNQAWRSLKQTPGELTTARKEWWRTLVCQVRAEFGLPDDDDYFEDLYATFARAAAWRVYPDVVPALKRAREQVPHVGLITNWDERLRPLLADLNLDGFDSIAVSCEVGCEKPSATIFEVALAAAGATPGEALHVGDSMTLDVNGARAVGMRGVLIDRAGMAGDDPAAVRALTDLDLGF